jgi:flagellin-like protein
MEMKKDNAVSPVIGVLLMLVVTIIIAAVVAAFTGGLTGETKKSPQIALSADYSQTGGLKIFHDGGDNVLTPSTKIFVGPTADFGSYEQLRWEVNTSKTTIMPANITWYDPTLAASKSARFFQAGDYAITSPDDVQPRLYGSSGTSDSSSGYYGFKNSKFVNFRFNLMIVDSEGRTIANTVVKIKP